MNTPTVQHTKAACEIVDALEVETYFGLNLRLALSEADAATHDALRDLINQAREGRDSGQVIWTERSEA